MRSGALGVMLACVVLARDPASAQGREVSRSEPESYLSAAIIADLSARVPPAPTPGSPQDVSDREASERLTALEDSDRWLLATRHAELRPAIALAHFDCALGFRIDAAQAPRLVSILAAVLHDANEAAEAAKRRAVRSRPVQDDPERRSCQVVTAAQRASASHPSGSASVGAAYGAVMGALVPERAEAVREIGRQIALSRAICGMHYPSDVADGIALGETVARAIIALPAFEVDAAAARAEIEAARYQARTSPACAAERAALATQLP